jgi:hypothetical protein
MAALFADEDFPFPAVRALRALGHDVLTTLEAGLAGVGTDDPEILAAATRLDRAVLTMNRRDYISLHRADPGHAGIIVCTCDDDTDALADRIHTQVSALISVVGGLFGNTPLAGQLVRVNRPNKP